MVLNELLKRAPNVLDILAAIALPKPIKTEDAAQHCRSGKSIGPWDHWSQKKI